MQDIFQVAGDMNEFAHVVVVKFEFGQLEEMLDIAKIAGDEVIHPDDMIAFFYETIAKM
jgi:hypothetical protein